MRARVDPREVNRLISTAESAGAVLNVVGQYADSPVFDQIHVSTAFVRLAKVKATIERGDTERVAVPKLVNELLRALKSRSLTAQSSANVLWAIVSMEKQMPQLLPLIPELMATIQLVAKDMKAQNIANVMWAAARCKIDSGASESLFVTLAERTYLGADSFNAQDIANVFWASGKLHKRGAPVSPFLDVLPILTEVAVQRADAMTAQHIANTLWGIADLRHEVSTSAFERDLIPILAEMLIKKAPKVSDAKLGFDFPQVVRAFALLEINHRPLLKMVATRCQQQSMLREMNDWGLCFVTWSYSDVFQDVEFSEFRNSLRAEIARRGTISEEMISRSQLGPDEWQT
eukprot:CAMPEP_0204111656 /NCGR_PEP_ID=MMETSP0361-20130328/2596_1 /ASSEMBLY_ACC=CAM_ASM_000343 /TAXON_ID=268821 /ORGANISM="Scrippsiella Hangoei, Strain SHTV-5" /LENGTH=345 /DNA_ID=CAMNT_0051061735 /DNA_START=1 /DNA_END=1038 /DNA_ORIENTATION=+